MTARVLASRKYAADGRAGSHMHAARRGNGEDRRDREHNPQPCLLAERLGRLQKSVDSKSVENEVVLKAFGNR